MEDSEKNKQESRLMAGLTLSLLFLLIIGGITAFTAQTVGFIVPEFGTFLKTPSVGIPVLATFHAIIGGIVAAIIIVRLKDKRS